MLTRYLALTVALLAVVVAPASAITFDSILTGTIGTLNLHAEANWTGSAWLYEYTLQCTNTKSIVHVFSVGNPNKSAYSGANNTAGFANPVWNPTQAAIQWSGSSLSNGQTAVFSYESLFQPAPQYVSALVVDSGTYATGQTLGMNSMLNSPAVPEAGTLSLAVGGLAAVSGYSLRRRRTRRQAAGSA